LTDLVFSSDFAILNHIGHTLTIGQHESGSAFPAGLFIVGLETILDERNGLAESGRRGEGAVDATGEAVG